MEWRSIWFIPIFRISVQMKFKKVRYITYCLIIFSWKSSKTYLTLKWEARANVLWLSFRTISDATFARIFTQFRSPPLPDVEPHSFSNTNNWDALTVAVVINLPLFVRIWFDRSLPTIETRCPAVKFALVNKLTLWFELKKNRTHSNQTPFIIIESSVKKSIRTHTVLWASRWYEWSSP